VIEGKTMWNENKKLFPKKKRFEKVNLKIDLPNFRFLVKRPLFKKTQNEIKNLTDQVRDFS
jgi:hypothetical protein